MSKRSKDHHYVPKVLQKRFLAPVDGEQVWYAERGEDGQFGAPYLKPIEKAFYKKNFYTVTVDDELSDIVEKKFYGKIDDYLGEILPKIVGFLERGVVPTFEGAALASLRNVTIEMAKRTPEFVKLYDDTQVGLDIVNATLSALPEDDEHAERKEMLAALNDRAKLREMGRHVRVHATIDPSERVIEELKQFSVRWSVSGTKHSYILASNMVYRTGNGGSNGLSNPDAEIWMPLSPKIALVLLRDPSGKIPLKSIDTPDHIRQLNEFAARSSNQIASHCQKLVESITGKKARLR